MRKKIIAGNWKMNLNAINVAQLAEGILSGLPNVKSTHEMVVFPSSLHLHMIVELFRGTGIKVGAQNIYPSKLAAFTGEICTEQLKDFGIQYALIGHSERRQFLGETDEFLNQKVLHVLETGLIPMLCVGETLGERESGKTFEVVKRQITKGLANVSKENAEILTIAYEPVWAIGTGKVATPEQAEEVHALIRNELNSIFGSVSNDIPVLYGGSVKPDNIKSLLEKPNIDGGLVGGASQKPESYLGLFS
ncbi:MAG: triose-phosphate isomerase [Leptospiraceae bacterium]|nr:triose-phosphate isomerase [Leptospiraceae bacterium]